MKPPRTDPLTKEKQELVLKYAYLVPAAVSSLCWIPYRLKEEALAEGYLILAKMIRSVDINKYDKAEKIIICNLKRKLLDWRINAEKIIIKKQNNRIKKGDPNWFYSGNQTNTVEIIPEDRGDFSYNHTIYNEAEEEIREILKVIQEHPKLNPKSKNIFQMFVACFSIPQIAKQLNMTRYQVNDRIRHCFQLIREHYGHGFPKMGPRKVYDIDRNDKQKVEKFREIINNKKSKGATKQIMNMFLDGYSRKEISQKLGIKYESIAKTVKYNLIYAYRVLESKLAGHKF